MGEEVGRLTYLRLPILVLKVANTRWQRSKTLRANSEPSNP